MRVLIIICAVLITVLAVGMYVFTRNQQLTPSSQNSVSETTKPLASQSPDTSKLNLNGSYQEYSKDSFEKNSGRRVLFFYASWCPECKEADPEFKSRTNEIPADIAIFRVNYNDPDTDAFEKDLAKKYAITYQHTFVQVDEQGNEVTKWNGGALDKLLSQIK